MIRINLLGATKKKTRKKRFRLNLPVIPANGPSIYVIALVVATIAISFNYGYYKKLTMQQVQLKSDLAAANQQAQQLAVVKNKFNERQKEAQELKRRFDVIDQLRANQATPAKLLDHVSSTVNSSDSIWLTALTQDNTSVKLSGMALSNIAVANFMTSLRRNEVFKNVELEELTQVDYKGVPAVNFRLNCDSSKDKPATQPAPGKPGERPKA